MATSKQTRPKAAKAAAKTLASKSTVNILTFLINCGKVNVPIGSVTGKGSGDAEKMEEVFYEI